MNMVHGAVHHHFERRRERHGRQSSFGVLLRVAHVAVRSIERARRLQINAMPPARGINDRDRAPLLRHQRRAYHERRTKSEYEKRLMAEPVPQECVHERRHRCLRVLEAGTDHRERFVQLLAHVCPGGELAADRARYDVAGEPAP